jgi:hypothetical protein
MDVCLVSRTARIVLLALVILLGIIDGTRSRDPAPAPLTAQPAHARTENETDGAAEERAGAPLRLSLLDPGD